MIHNDTFFLCFMIIVSLGFDELLCQIDAVFAVIYDSRHFFQKQLTYVRFRTIMPDVRFHTYER